MEIFSEVRFGVESTKIILASICCRSWSASAEGIIVRRHENAALQVDDSVGNVFFLTLI